MRVISFVLVALVFLIAFGNFLIAPKSVATTPEGVATTPASAATAPAGAATAVRNFLIGPKSVATAPEGVANTPLSVATAPASVATAQNVCVHRADGATVCGPVVPSSRATSSPFDQPVAQPITPSLLAAKLTPLQLQTAHEAERNLRASKHVKRPPLGSQPEKQSARRTAREDAQSFKGERDRRFPPVVERKPPVRDNTADVRHLEKERRPIVRNNAAEQNLAGGRYRADRGSRPLNDRESPLRYSAGNLRGPEDEHERLRMMPDRERATPRYGADRGSPPIFEGRPPVRYSGGNFRRYEDGRESAPIVPQQERAAHGYNANRDFPSPRINREREVQFADIERRTLELERELRALRTDRTKALRSGERSDVSGHFYPKRPPASGGRESRQQVEPSTIDQLITRNALSLGDPVSDRDQPRPDRYRQPTGQR